LAARTGVARYGRNNITYVPEHGSFHRLVAYYTDLDLGLDQWQEREALPACKTCDLCQKACPASVISRDTFVIRVERCLTFLNELPVDRPFPPRSRPNGTTPSSDACAARKACPYDRKVKAG